MSTVYIQKESAMGIVLTNDTGSDLIQFEFTVIGGLSLVANEAIANGEKGPFDGTRSKMQIEDFEAGEDTFGTADADVFWNPATGDFSDTSTAGYYKIGIVKEVKNSNGVVLALKNEEAVLISTAVADNTTNIATNAADIVTAEGNITTLQGEMLVEQAEPKILVFPVTVDASGSLAIPGLVENDEIIGVSVICTVTQGSGTLIVETGGDDDITDGIVCATDKAVIYAASIDDDFSTLPASGAKVISVGGTAAHTRGIVVISYIPA